MTQTAELRRVAKWAAIGAAIIAAFVVLLFEVSYFMAAAEAYKASIVRETVEAIKHAK